jgi:hypothetical protein
MACSRLKVHKFKDYWLNINIKLGKERLGALSNGVLVRNSDERDY